MGRWSFSAHQRDERRPNLIPLDQLAVETLMSPNPDTVTADHPLDECLIEMARENRRWVPVLDDDHYLGLLALTEIAKIPPDRVGPSHRTRRCSHRRTCRSPLRLRRAHRRDRSENTARSAVAIIDDGRVIGVVTIRDIANIERLLDRLDTEADP